ncbi:MAG TPA: TolC family protein [Gemmatimonadales bacterium]|nr:TolC family protein [Gemmatimonadales bacterium]
MRVEFTSGARAVLCAALTLLASVSAYGQAAQPAPPAQAPAAAAQPAPAGPARPLTVDEAVTLALEQNLGVQVERINPQLQDLSIAQARTAWLPNLFGGFSATTQDSPPSSFLSGASDKITNTSQGGNFGVTQLLPFGTEYQVSYDTNRLTTNNVFSSFNPQLGANLDFTVVQPLLRGLRIDSARLQLMTAQKNREIADVGLAETIASTTRQVKNAYWDYKYALASLQVARQSLELAQESLRNTRSRVEIGTLAPIDVVEAESEVAQREEAVILAEAAIGQTEDFLRSLIFDPNTPEFWTMRLEPVDPVPFQVQTVDVNAAVTRALAERTDLQQSKKSIERASFTERFYKDQSLPAVDVQVDYNSTGLAGTQLVRGGDTFPPPVIGEVEKPYSDLLSDIFSSEFPTWRFALNVSYPLGQSTAEASLARTRLEVRQSQTNLRSLELQVVTQVRDAARQLIANSKRVDATRAARVLADRRLEAEEKKFAAGMSTSFLVFQAQRDLAQARNNELRATLDYTQSQVDYETVQVAPIGGGSGFTATAAVGTAIGATTGAGAAGAAGTAAAPR